MLKQLMGLKTGIEIKTPKVVAFHEYVKQKEGLFRCGLIDLSTEISHVLHNEIQTAQEMCVHALHSNRPELGSEREFSCLGVCLFFCLPTA